MQELPRHRRMLLLTEGRLGVFSSKTAAAILRFRGHDVAGIIDSTTAKRDVREFVPFAPRVPIFASVADAAACRPDSLYIGVAPVGGALPETMRRHVVDALMSGLHVVSGLHNFLGDDEQLAAPAKASGAVIHDVRRPPTEQIVASKLAAQCRCRRVLTVGTDCNVGKMFAALRLRDAVRERGIDGRFAATGQTGIMIEGWGTAIDAVVSDFAAGAAEQLVTRCADSQLCIVEGQGSLSHPGFSAVTLALLHGVCPHALVLVHHLGRATFSAPPRHALPNIGALIAAYEATAALVHPTRVVGIAVNSHGVDAAAAREERAALEQQFALPTCDLAVDDPGPMVEAIMQR
ncbi:MAG: DUF1611 domain-containing protein [Phycisphaerales bacterium]|nr:DUF1611 domain-containing protein [Phycisphaerales bacterium]